MDGDHLSISSVYPSAICVSEVIGDTVAFVVKSLGSITNNNNGTWTLKPLAHYSGNIHLNFTVSDGRGGSSQGSQSFYLNPVNDVPVLTGQPMALPNGQEDQVYKIAAADLLKGFTDAEGDALQVENLQASIGTIKASGDGNWILTPPANAHGQVQLHYNVVDGNGGRTSADRSFHLEEVNDAPELQPSATVVRSSPEDQTVLIRQRELLNNWSDVDGDQLSVVDLKASKGVLRNQGNGTWSLTPPQDFFGNIELSYGVSDGRGGLSQAHQNLDITEVNDAPVFLPITPFLPNGKEDVLYLIEEKDILKNVRDVDGDVVSISNVQSSRGTLVNNGNGIWTLTPQQDFCGDLSITITISDGRGGINQRTGVIHLDPVNDVPSPTAAVDLGAIEEYIQFWATGGIRAGNVKDALG